ncbi:MAG: VanW family protein [Chloroflexota bacterium]
MRKIDSFLRFGIFLGFLIVLGGATAVFQHVYAGRVSPHVSVGGIALGGVALNHASSYLTHRVDQRDQRPIVLHLNLPDGQRTFEVNARQFHAAYDLQPPLAAAMADGHRDDALTNLWNQFNTMVQGHNYAIQGTHDQQAVVSYIAALDKRIDIPPQPAQVGVQNGQVVITRHMVPGTIIDAGAASRILSRVIDGHAVYDVTLPLLRVSAPVDDTVAQEAVDEARTLLSQPTYFSSVNKVRAWYLTPKQLIRLLTFKSTYVKNMGWRIALHMDAKRLSATMAPIAAAVDRAPIPTVFTVADLNGTVTPVPQPDGPGTLIDYDRIGPAILAAGSTNHTVIIPLVHPRAKFNLQVARALNFNTVMGEGPTSLTGASSDRVHNATVAADAISNIRLKPGAVFSVAQALGPITKVHGYEPGLNQTGKQDISGADSGVTQVASALFSAAFSAGLPILDRLPYPNLTSFNGPPGTDAQVTARGEGPDLVFQNNTKHLILLNVTVTRDRVTAYLFNNGETQRTVETSGPTVQLNQDGSIDASISRVVRGDVSLQDSIATHYKAIDPYP